MSGLVQHADFNVGPAHYEGLGHDTLLVYGQPFATVQGEGPFIGRPSVFLRLPGCNKGDKVSCPGCDTRFHYREGQLMSFRQIRDAVEVAVGDSRINLLVITGGEPTMQNNLGLFILWWMTHAERGNGEWQIQLESNGDRPIMVRVQDSIIQPLPGQVGLTLVVSPKVLPTSQKYGPLNQQVIAQRPHLKYVVAADPASPYHDVPELHPDTLFATRSVWVSPWAVYLRPVEAGEVPSIFDPTLIDQRETRLNYAHAYQLAMRRGFRITPQLHLFLNVA